MTKNDTVLSERSTAASGQRSSPIAKAASGSSRSAEPDTRNNVCITAEDFDAAFDRGEDISEHLDMSTARRPGLERWRINLDLPNWMVHSLDRQAEKRGVTRQALIKMWLADRLEAAG